MKNNDRYTSIFWAAFGLYIAFEGSRLEMGNFRNPEAGFLVFWAGIILAGLSIILLIQTFFGSQENGKSLWKGVKWSTGIKLMVALFIYTIVFQPLGFILSTFLLLLFLFKGLEPQRWGVALLLSVISITALDLLFGVFLEFHFPLGILEQVVKLFH